MTINYPFEEQKIFKDDIDKFKKSTKPKISDIKEKRELNFENVVRLLKGRKNIHNGFESKIFPIGKHTHGKRRPLDLARVANVSDWTQIKILTPKQILQRFSIGFA